LNPNENRNPGEPGSAPEPAPLRAPWPQPLRITSLVLSLAMLIAACVSLVFAHDVFRTGDARVALGGAGGSVALFTIAISSFRSAGFRNLRQPRKLGLHHDPTHGAGISIPTGRTAVFTTVVAMLGLTAYGGTAAFAWHIGLGETLLPFGRDNREGALFVSLCAAVLGTIAVLIACVRFDTTLYIYRGGVRRHVCRRIFLKKQVLDTFVPWGSITRIGAGDLGVRGGTTAHPVIDLHTAEPLPSDSRTRHDSEHRLAVMAHQLVVEPNTLFALLEKLAEDPACRERLVESDAIDLLCPPPLRERFRAARAKKAIR